MKNTIEIQKILDSCQAVEVHVHTHLCDGAADMTVANIVTRAKEQGIDALILTPHFHRQVSDATETLYTDTDEEMLLRLREEIEAQEGCGVRLLLSVEADILSTSGELALPTSREALDALDLVTPTMNYHPLLPLKFVRLTYGKEVDGLHDSGEYAAAAEKLGGVERVLETAYETQANAVRSCPYPAMLGHFFAAHSVHPDRNTWFGAREEHLSLMKAGATRVIEACRDKAAILDLTGVHMKIDTVEEKQKKNGFLLEFQRFTVEEGLKNGVRTVAGADAHRLSAIGRSRPYYDALWAMSGKSKESIK